MKALAALATCALATAAIAGSPPSPGGLERRDEAPPRIVSINPCVDSILVRVAEPGQILGISHYSQDPEETSIPLDVARRYRGMSGTAEEVVALAPDIVMSGPHVSPSTIFALERIHVRILKFRAAESVEESTKQIREVSAAVGAPEKGEALVREIEGAVAAARSAQGPRISALIWQRGGMVPGRGTLADQLLQLTGFENISRTYGLKKWDVLPLEYLIASPPQLVLSTRNDAGDGDRMLGHPAVRKLARNIAFRNYPFRLLSCGGPSIVEAVSRLAQVRRELK